MDTEETVFLAGFLFLLAVGLKVVAIDPSGGDQWLRLVNTPTTFGVSIGVVILALVAGAVLWVKK